MFSRNEISELVAKFSKDSNLPVNFKIIEDTTDFFVIDYNDVLILGDRPYLAKNCAKEGRFGIDDQDKFWVRRAIDLIDGSTKIIKMIFQEEFEGKSGGLQIDFNRSSSKESRILKKTRGHPNFMQGFDVPDKAGNRVRIIDFIKGATWNDYIVHICSNHQDYYYNHFNEVLRKFIKLVEAIAYIHSRGEIHGDIRRDHIINETATGIDKWIDFDLNYIIHGESHFQYDLMSLGNVLAFITGRGDVKFQRLSGHSHSLCQGTLTMEDLNVNFKNRIINLKKVYPYIPEKLNEILLRFSCGATVSYDSIDQFISDLKELET